MLAPDRTIPIAKLGAGQHALPIGELSALVGKVVLLVAIVIIEADTGEESALRAALIVFGVSHAVSPLSRLISARMAGHRGAAW